MPVGTIEAACCWRGRREVAGVKEGAGGGERVEGLSKALEGWGECSSSFGWGGGDRAGGILYVYRTRPPAGWIGLWRRKRKGFAQAALGMRINTSNTPGSSFSGLCFPLWFDAQSQAAGSCWMMGQIWRGRVSWEASPGVRGGRREVILGSFIRRASHDGPSRGTGQGNRHGWCYPQSSSRGDYLLAVAQKPIPLADAGSCRSTSSSYPQQMRFGSNAQP